MADRTSIHNTLVQFLREDTPAETTGLIDATDLRDGLGLDSVDFVGVIMRMEGHYHIRLTRDEMNNLNTVGDLLTLVQSKTSSLPLAA